MAQNESEQSKVVQTQLSLEQLREYVAAGLAFLIVLGMLVLSYIAVVNLSNQDTFQRAKDLLLIITPFVGVVIGYYFNKVTSDARAAALQRTVDDTSRVALSATADSQRAEQQAQLAQSQADRMRGALTDVVTAVDNSGATKPGTLGTLGPGDAEATERQINLRVAMERARRALEN